MRQNCDVLVPEEGCGAVLGHGVPMSRHRVFIGSLSMFVSPSGELLSSSVVLPPMCFRGTLMSMGSNVV